MTNFELMMWELDLPHDAKVLDVGAGGFVGETTTKHLVNKFDHVFALEQNEAACGKLREKYTPEILTVLCGSIEEFVPLFEYDLMVVDLNSGQIPFIRDTLIEHYGRYIVRIGGYIITLWESTMYLHSLNWKVKHYYPKWVHCPYGWLVLERMH